MPWRGLSCECGARGSDEQSGLGWARSARFEQHRSRPGEDDGVCYPGAASGIVGEKTRQPPIFDKVLCQIFKEHRSYTTSRDTIGIRACPPAAVRLYSHRYCRAPRVPSPILYRAGSRPSGDDPHAIVVRQNTASDRAATLGPAPARGTPAGVSRGALSAPPDRSSARPRRRGGLLAAWW